MIKVNNISKEFKVPVNENGFIKKFKSLFVRKHTIKQALTDVSFNIDEGDIVGYVGPNGAGKSTTIKILSGILLPTSGNVSVAGIDPYKNRIQNAKNIGVVFGQRSQLYWDLPMRDSFLLHQKMYEIEENVYKSNVAMFTEILQMESFIDQPTRQLSLGQRMRANIALSLLHNPKIVYLDEPTIGLDIVVKKRIREFIVNINKEKNTTFILTTHDMDDIELVCKRLIMIDKGTLHYDGLLENFKNNFGSTYKITVTLNNSEVISHPLMTVKQIDEFTFDITCDKKSISVGDTVSFISSNHSVKDIKIQEGDLESILTDMYVHSNA